MTELIITGLFIAVLVLLYGIVMYPEWAKKKILIIKRNEMALLFIKSILEHNAYSVFLDKCRQL